MAAPPLERESEAERIRTAIRSAHDSGGVMVTIEGPAGVGKSTLLRHLLDTSDRPAALGICDDLAIPQPLGPFVDIAREHQMFATELDSGTGAFRTFLIDYMTQGFPALIAIEDVHWADQLTIDALAYVGRRIDRARAAVLVTFRSEVPPNSPVRRLLGQVPPDRLMRVQLEELSLAAVKRMAEGSGRDPDHLYALTGGNPFLVTELLAADDAIPQTVADSVGARLAAMPHEAADTAELLSVTTGEVEWEIIESLLPSGSTALADLELNRLVVSTPNGVGYRHELLRQVVADRLTATRKRELHRQILDASLAHNPSPSHLAHHAAGAGDVQILVRSSKEAVEVATEAGAHVEALRHIDNLIPHVETVTERERAEIWDMAARAYWFNQRTDDSLAAAVEAAALWEDLEEPGRWGASLNHASRVEWQLAHPQRANELLLQAIAVLETQPHSPQLAHAYIAQGQRLGMSSRIEEALSVLDRAVESAARTENPLVLGKAYSAREPWRLAVGDSKGARADGDMAAEMLLQCQAQDGLSVLYGNRIAAAINTLNLEHVDDDLEVARRFAERIDSLNLDVVLAAQSGRLHLYRGEWAQAEKNAAWVLEMVEKGMRRCTAATVIAALHGRGGEETALPYLDEAIALAETSNDIQRLGPAAAVAAELTWLGMTDGLEFVQRVWELARVSGFKRWHAEIAVWLRRLGQGAAYAPTGVTGPHQLELDGNFVEAAAEWSELGLPYERALSSAFSGDGKLMARASREMDDLGATASRDRVRQMLREQGYTLRRGASRSTRSNPMGLTRRQMEVLELVAKGLTNAEIGERLFISAKTVDHHISAILTKTGTSTRTEAVRLLRLSTSEAMGRGEA